LLLRLRINYKGHQQQHLTTDEKQCRRVVMTHCASEAHTSV
jgi:hypothetical protein